MYKGHVREFAIWWLMAYGVRSRGRLILLVMLCAMSAAAIVPAPVEATSGNQAAPGQLIPLQPMTGTLDASVPQVTYVFEVQPGFIFSLVAWTRFGDLTPEMTLANAAGQPIATGVPLQTGLNSRAIDAVAGTDGTYTITLQRGKRPATRLLLLPGYSVLDKWDDFQSFDQALAQLGADVEHDSIADVMNGVMNMQVMTAGTMSFILPSDSVSWSDVYIEADIQIEGSQLLPVWLILRANPAFYALFSSDSDWTLMHYNMGMWNSIQD